MLCVFVPLTACSCCRGVMAVVQHVMERRHQHMTMRMCLAAGSWRLLWTSEASVHGIVKGPIPVTDIQQHIELQ